MNNIVDDTVELSLVVPVANGASFFRDTLQQIKKWMSNRRGIELIVVDDGSVDATASIIVEELQGFPYSKYIHLPINQGKGAALRTGFGMAQGRFVAFTDADLPYGLGILSGMIERMKNTADLALVFGSRSHSLSQNKKGYGMIRKLGRSFFSAVVRHMVIHDVLDSQSGTKMLRHDLSKLSVMNGKIDRFAFDIELFAIARANGLHYADFPVEFTHQQGNSSVRIVKDTLQMLGDIIKIKRNIAKGSYTKNR